MWDRNLGNVPIADVAVTDTGVVVCAGSGVVSYWRFALDGALLAQEDHGPGWHPRTDGRTVVYQNDHRFCTWVPGVGDGADIPGQPVGNNSTGISPQGIVFVQRDAADGFALGVYCGSVKVENYRPTGIWESHDDGTVAMMDLCNRPDYAPGPGGYVHRCGDLMVKEGPRGGVQVWFEGARRLLYGGTDTMWPRVSVHSGVVGIVSWGNLGLRLWVGTLDDVRALPLDEVPVVVPPAPTHLTGCGYYFRDTAIYAFIQKYGGENPSAPGTHSLIVDDHGLPAEPHPDGHTPRMIIGLSQIPAAARWWDQVDAVNVAVENDEVGLNRMADLARMNMDWLGLAPKPILSYSGGAVYPNALHEDDILGIQLYADRSADPAANIMAQAARIGPLIQQRRRVAIIGQAYDRGGWFTGPQIAAIQPVLYETACAWPNCELLLWFSDSRRGGTRDYEVEVRPWHKVIAEAIGRR